MDFYLGIDVSTTATKALLINENGDLAGSVTSSYPYQTPKPLWSEQHPDVWWDAAVKSISKMLAKTAVDPKDIKGVGLTGQMHGLVLLDEKGRVLRPAILWNDQRTGEECEQIRECLGLEELVRTTGNDALTSFTLPKILWVQAHEPEIWEETRQILLPKDYIRYKLSDTYALDKAGGSGTILFDVGLRDWSAELLKIFEIPVYHLPQTYEGTHVTGEVSREAANATGLIAGTPVYGGGGDQQAGAVGTGAVEEGIISISLGTSGVVVAAVNGPYTEHGGRLNTFCHAVEGKWILMGAMLSAGGSLRWYRDTFFPGMDFPQLLESIPEVPAGSDGLIFLPYLTGERTPYPDPLARGAFIGMTNRHDARHMTRAVVEGISFGLRDCYELMKESGIESIKQVRITGGGAQSQIWRQILADVLGTEIVMVNSVEGAAYGAALLAACGEGAYKSVEEACRAVIQVTDQIEPGKDVLKYDECYSSYHQLYPILKQTFAELSSED
jgi:xylulokinase